LDIEAKMQASQRTDAGQRAGLFWMCVVVFVAAAVYAAFFAPGISGQYQAAEASLHEWVASLFPKALRSGIAGAAHVFLTPWLYLTLMIAFLAERLFPANPNQKFLSLGMVQDLVTWFIFNSVLRLVLIGAFVHALMLGMQKFLPFMILIEPSRWNPVAAVLVGLVVVDFLNWFHHYLRHRVPLLWSFHAVHHSQKEMNMFTELRVHLFEYVIAKPIVLIPLFVLGLGELQIIWVVVVLSAYSQLYHANIRSHFGPLRYILVTPQSHRVHHSADPRHQDLNFGVIFCIWDRLFGTHWHDHTEYPETGVYDSAFPYEQMQENPNIFVAYYQQMVYPFRVIWHAMHGKGWKLDSDKRKQTNR